MRSQLTVAPTAGPSADGAPSLVEAPEVAQRYKVSKRTVYRLAASGAIPSYRVGRSLRFDLDEVGSALRDAA